MRCVLANVPQNCNGTWQRHNFAVCFSKCLKITVSCSKFSPYVTNLTLSLGLCFRFCYTARGGFCFPEDSIQEFHDSSGGSGGAPFEGVEICNFNLDGAHYMIYTPVDPLLFVAVKDKDGVLRIAEDDLMDDPNIVNAIDEETEFTALVEEEEALLESILHDDDNVS
uniref:Uncharacterized protein n=1 Tax=Avena sativa TaxID=4498 RepID=A0ACD6ABL7_AVESA